MDWGPFFQGAGAVRMYLDHGAVQRDRLDFESQDLFPLQIFEDPLQNSALG